MRLTLEILAGILAAWGWLLFIYWGRRAKRAEATSAELASLLKCYVRDCEAAQSGWRRESRWSLLWMGLCCIYAVVLWLVVKRNPGLVIFKKP